MKAVFAYIPVVHAGVLSFLHEHEGVPVFLLDNEEGKKENPYLERDIRALSAFDIKKELEAHGFANVQVVKPADMRDAFSSYELLVVPEDEIVFFFLEKYAPAIATQKVNVFLRWTKQISTTENTVPPDRTISHDAFAVETLRSLETEAQKSPDWWRQIGAAIVKEGEVVATAFNKHYPSAHALTLNGDPRSNLYAGQGPGIYTSIHAEACALAHAAREGIPTQGADIYVTTFPCPTCARSLVEAGIARVFYTKGYSLLDAEDILKHANIEIVLVKD